MRASSLLLALTDTPGAGMTAQYTSSSPLTHELLHGDRWYPHSKPVWHLAYQRRPCTNPDKCASKRDHGRLHVVLLVFSEIM